MVDSVWTRADIPLQQTRQAQGDYLLIFLEGVCTGKTYVPWRWGPSARTRMFEKFGICCLEAFHAGRARLQCATLSHNGNTYRSLGTSRRDAIVHVDNTSRPMSYLCPNSRHCSRCTSRLLLLLEASLPSGPHGGFSLLSSAETQRRCNHDGENPSWCSGQDLLYVTPYMCTLTCPFCCLSVQAVSAAASAAP